MKRLAGIVFALMLMGLLTACGNTAHGVGKDLENMGEWIQTNT